MQIQVLSFNVSYKEEVKHFIASWKEKHTPIYTFTAEDGVEHVAWKIADEEVIASLVNLFEDILIFILQMDITALRQLQSRAHAKNNIRITQEKKSLISSYQFYSSR